MTLNPYNKEATCPKCHFAHIGSELWDLKKVAINWLSHDSAIAQAWEKKQELVQRKCFNCGHNWFEHPLDTPEVENIIEAHQAEMQRLRDEHNREMKEERDGFTREMARVRDEATKAGRLSVLEKERDDFLKEDELTIAQRWRKSEIKWKFTYFEKAAAIEAVSKDGKREPVLELIGHYSDDRAHFGHLITAFLNGETS